MSNRQSNALLLRVHAAQLTTYCSSEILFSDLLLPFLGSFIPVCFWGAVIFQCPFFRVQCRKQVNAVLVHTDPFALGLLGKLLVQTFRQAEFELPRIFFRIIWFGNRNIVLDRGFKPFAFSVKSVCAHSFNRFAASNTTAFNSANRTFLDSKQIFLAVYPIVTFKSSFLLLYIILRCHIWCQAVLKNF